jgi:nicotinamide mononucleotide adenylyltransferase
MHSGAGLTGRVCYRCTDPKKTPLVLVACGSFSPVTFLHLRMFEMARDHARTETSFEVVGGYLSLVNDAYKKPGLAPSVHRYNMCRLACDKTSDWLMVDPFEARSKDYVPTAPVLDHFDDEINKKRKGVAVVDEQGNEAGRKDVRIILLAGSDLIQTMSEPGVWAEQDVSRSLHSGFHSHSPAEAVLTLLVALCVLPSSTTS